MEKKIDRLGARKPKFPLVTTTLGVCAMAIAFAQGPGGGPIPPGTTRYAINVPAGFPPPPIPLDNVPTNEGVALGKRLFNETRLSGNNSQSCASCHRPGYAFSDEGKALSVGIAGKKGTRNAPALFNLVYHPSYFWDGRTPTLRAQALQPIQNPAEMDQTLPKALANLSADKTYPAQFAKAFGSKGVTSDRIGLALEQYLVTVMSGSSKFDLSQRGLASLTPTEQRGLDVFRTPYSPPQRQFGGDCARCHGGPLFTNFQFINNGLDSVPADLGREDVTGRPSDRGKFKVPSLRNLTASGPYMHDGRFSTLLQVVQHYSTGIVESSTLDPGLAHEPGGVKLSSSDQAALVAFLKTLADPAFTSGVANP